jgi:uncharacterized membrane protein YdjX (TVP38/TMEM64 family)
MNKTRILLVILIVAVISAVFWLDLTAYLTLDFFRKQQDILQAYVESNFGSAIATYFLLYVAIAALNIPGATIMTLAAGALFGLLAGTVIVSFASTIGATLAFLLSRFLLRDYIERRFGKIVTRINTGIDKEGNYYLFTLRLVPIFPFFVINMAMGDRKSVV